MADPYNITFVGTNVRGTLSGAGTTSLTLKCVAAVPSRQIIGEQQELLGRRIRVGRTQARIINVVFCGFAATAETDQWDQLYSVYDEFMDLLSRDYPYTYITACNDPTFAAYEAAYTDLPVQVEPTSDGVLQPDPEHGSVKLLMTFRKVDPL